MLGSENVTSFKFYDSKNMLNKTSPDAGVWERAIVQVLR